ncbi:hypothetical protein HK100_010883, partial [Physocladia obscura]
MDAFKAMFLAEETIPGRDQVDGPGESGSGKQQQQRGKMGKVKQQQWSRSVSPLEFYSRLAGFAGLWIVGPVCALAVSAPLLLIKPFSHSLFRAAVRQVEKAVGGLMVLTAWLFCSGAALVLTGDFDLMRSDRKQLVFSNHQNYADWFFIWLAAWAKQCHGDVRAVLIKVIMSIPVVGQVLHIFEFIPMYQKLEKDRATMSQNLSVAKNDAKLPLWLLIFPEGGFNWKGNVEK